MVKITPNESTKWNGIFKLGYDALHNLAEAWLLLNGFKAKTHECVFAYLCVKYPYLELDRNFLERLRTVRNGAVYYGQAATHEHWKTINLQLNLYIQTLKKDIEAKL